MELLHESSQRPQQVDYICKKGPTADVWLDSKSALDCCVVNVGFRWTESLWNLYPQACVQGSRGSVRLYEILLAVM